MLFSVGSWMYSVRIPWEVAASPFSTAVGCPDEQPTRVRAIRVTASLPLMVMGDVLLWTLLEVPNFVGGISQPLNHVQGGLSVQKSTIWPRRSTAHRSWGPQPLSCHTR